MPNILQMQEILKGIPDDKLMQEVQQPTGNAPTYLVMTEIERRKKVRDEYTGQLKEQDKKTVLEDMIAPPEDMMAPPPMMQAPSNGMQMPPSAGQIPPSAPSQMPMPPAPPPSMGMEAGGSVYMQTGGGMESVDKFINMLGDIDRKLLSQMVEAEAGGESAEGKKAVASVIVNRILSGKFPNTLEGVLKQRSAKGYQFSPLNDLKGDLSKLGEATDETEDVIEELLTDFGNQNPVGNAVLFQNPDLATPFPIMDQDKSAGKRIGKHVFYDRYSINNAAEDFSPYYGSTAGQVASVDDNQQIARAVADVNKKAGLGNLLGGALDSAKSYVMSLVPSGNDAGSETRFVPRGKLPDLNLAALQRLGRTTPQPSELLGKTDGVIDNYELLVPPTLDTKEQRVADTLAKAEAKKATQDQERRASGIRQRDIRTPSAGNQYVQDMLRKIKAQNARVYATAQTPQQMFEAKKTHPSVTTKQAFGGIPDAYTGQGREGLSALANLAPDQPYAFLGDRSTAEFLEDPIRANMLKEQKAYENFKGGKYGEEMISNVDNETDKKVSDLQPVASDGQYAQLLADIAKSQDDAKAMGLLTAGLGIMQQASQPGATFLSSIPGAQAGVKQFTDDKAALAKRQIALATLANQKRATDIAARKAQQLPKYQAVRENLRVALFNDPTRRDKYFDKEGRPNAAFEELVIDKTKTLDPSLTGSRLMQTYVKYEDSDAGKARLAQIRKGLIKRGMKDADAWRQAPIILRNEFLKGSSGVSWSVTGA